MGIRLQVQDGMVEIGGSFEAALSFVRGLPGRRYDPATKTWTASISLGDLRLSTYLPIEVVASERQCPAAGCHITRYGNVYSAEEWREYQAALEEERKETAQRSRKMAAAEREAARRLLAAGVPAEAVERLIPRLWELKELAEEGAIRFSSEERRQAVMAVAEWFGGEIERIALGEEEGR